MHPKCEHTYSNPDPRLPCPYCWKGEAVFFLVERAPVPATGHVEPMRMRHSVVSNEDGTYRLRSRPVSTALARSVRYRLMRGAAGERSWQEDAGTTITKG